MFRKNCLKDRINGVHRKATKKTRETKYLHKTSFPQKTNPKIVSMILHRKRIDKRISNLKNFFPIENLFHKNITQKLVSMGYAGEIIKNIFQNHKTYFL